MNWGKHKHLVCSTISNHQKGAHLKRKPLHLISLHRRCTDCFHLHPLVLDTWPYLSVREAGISLYSKEEGENRCWKTTSCPCHRCPTFPGSSKFHLILYLDYYHSHLTSLSAFTFKLSYVTVISHQLKSTGLIKLLSCLIFFSGSLFLAD